MTRDGTNLTLRISETAKVLGLGRNSCYEAARRGDIPTVIIGRRMFVPVAALQRILSEAGTAPAS